MFELLHLAHVQHFSALNQDGMPSAGDVWDHFVCPADGACPDAVDFSLVVDKIHAHAGDLSPFEKCVVATTLKHFDHDADDQITKNEFVSFMHNGMSDGPTVEHLKTKCGHLADP
eukprot:CAMPEP_0181295696 /NCGR_PEP_ID=MMETSP1101-20121128/4288_1 /TAXON_ID=46948 /ORGANISM="Rhodomonas abbreviata, Strain Caron Lab Isolate" /LENGTH=114 /DNA_ID=CAMNT_0023400471 /DNA_START=18 /DNA_END=362 /DNA_ORIENTATION=-